MKKSPNDMNERNFANILDRVTSVAVLLVVLLAGAVLVKDFLVQPSSPSPAVFDAPEQIEFDLEGMPALGVSDAKVVLVEFADYECPFCRRHAAGVGREIVERFVSSGTVRYVFANNPLPNHPNAVFLSTAAICAGHQNRYWEMHGSLFESELTARPDILSLVETLGLDLTEFEKCLDESPEPARRIDMDIQKATALQLTGTPSFAVGRMNDQKKFEIEKVIIGAQPIRVFEGVINEILKAQAFSSRPVQEQFLTGFEELQRGSRVS